MIDIPQKIVCVGLNYLDHPEEQGVDLPERPLLFAKWPNTLIASGDPIRIPAICKNPDYEAELGVVLGRQASRVPEDDPPALVPGSMAGRPSRTKPLPCWECRRMALIKAGSVDVSVTVTPFEARASCRR